MASAFNDLGLDELTSTVLVAFGEVLGFDDISEEDDFFDDCGGTSLQAWGAIVFLEDKLDIDLEFDEFIVARTARATAELLASAPR